jgi:hypothetical protein
MASHFQRREFLKLAGAAGLAGSLAGAELLRQGALMALNLVFFGSLEKIYIDGRSPEHKWEDAGPYYEQNDHFLWKALGEAARNSSDGGEDYVELHQFVRAVRNKTQTPGRCL